MLLGIYVPGLRMGGGTAVPVIPSGGGGSGVGPARLQRRRKQDQRDERLDIARAALERALAEDEELLVIES